MDGKKYIILEIIPTALDPNRGEIIQLSALKLNGYILEDRFDYRLQPSQIMNKDLEVMTSYDKKSFHYVKYSKKILSEFEKWCNGYDLLIIDNLYTESYLEKLPNKKESIFKYLNLTFSDDIIEIIMEKYNLQPSNHIVDLLYEALIEESNRK